MTDHPTPPTEPAGAGPAKGKPDRSNDREILQTFVGVYCQKMHGAPHRMPGEPCGTHGSKAPDPGLRAICPECAGLLAYALERLDKCPFDPKPACRNCKVHCYAEPFRSRIKEVMKTAGMHFVLRGRLDWLWKYFRGT